MRKSLPFLGKLAVVGIDGAEDIIDVAKQAVIDVPIEYIKDVGTIVVNFVVSLFGGDDSPAPHPAYWQEPNAYRSYRSGHSLAARLFESENEYGADRVTFLSFARTGSKIRDGLLGPRTTDTPLLGANMSLDVWTKNRGQIQEVRDTILGRRIDALMITVGVNDLGFSGALTNLVENDASILSALGVHHDSREKVARDREKQIKTDLPRDFELLKQSVDSMLNPRHVLITEYPAGLFTKFNDQNRVVDGGPCGIFTGALGNLDLDVNDGRTIRHLGQLLNGLIQTKASQFGWTYVDGIEHGFNGHGYCAKHSYFVSAEESCLHQGDFEGMVHPNEKGHTVTRDRIVQAMRKMLLTEEADWLSPVLQVMMQ